MSKENILSKFPETEIGSLNTSILVEETKKKGVEILGENNEKRRENLDYITTNMIGFLRHGNTEKNKGENQEKNQIKGPDELLSQEEFSENSLIRQRVRQLKNMGFTKDNIVIYTSIKILRDWQTAMIVCDELGIEMPVVDFSIEVRNKYLLSLGEDFNGVINDQLIIDERLQTRDKGDEKGRKPIPPVGTFDNLGQESLFHSINRNGEVLNYILNEESLKGKGKLYLCIGHRTGLAAFRTQKDNVSTKGKYTIDMGSQVGELDILGLTKNGEIINKNKDVFSFDIEKYEEEKEYLGKLLGVELEGNGVIENQNLVNQEVNKLDYENKIELFKLLFTKGLTVNLKIYAFANIVQLGLFDLILNDISKVFFGENANNIFKLLDGLFSIFNKMGDKLKTEKQKFMDVLLHLNTGGLSLDSLNIITNNRLEYIFTYNNYVVENKRYIRAKSLDKRINDGDEIPISISIENQQTKDEINNMSDFIKYINSAKKILIIQAQAGAGKSVKMLQIMEYLRPRDDNDLYPVYKNLGEGRTLHQLKLEISQEILLLQGKGYNFVYLFDALDESRLNNDEKIELFNYIQELQNKGNKVILTTRPGNLPDFENDSNKEKFNKLLDIFDVKPLNIDEIQEYINNHLNKEKIEEWNKWKKSEFFKDIESNPLMLSMLCNLIIVGEDFSKINSKADLYEKIIDLRLRDWELEKRNRQIGLSKDSKNYQIFVDKNIEKKKKVLGRVAFDSIMYYPFKVRKVDIEYLMSEMEICENIDSLNLIFKPNENEDYQFIHEGFREYLCIYHIIYSKLYKLDVLLEFEQNRINGKDFKGSTTSPYRDIDDILHVLFTRYGNIIIMFFEMLFKNVKDQELIIELSNNYKKQLLKEDGILFIFFSETLLKNIKNQELIIKLFDNFKEELFKKHGNFIIMFFITILKNIKDQELFIKLFDNFKEELFKKDFRLIILCIKTILRNIKDKKLMIRLFDSYRGILYFDNSNNIDLLNTIIESGIFSNNYKYICIIIESLEFVEGYDIKRLELLYKITLLPGFTLNNLPSICSIRLMLTFINKHNYNIEMKELKETIISNILKYYDNNCDCNRNDYGFLRTQNNIEFYNMLFKIDKDGIIKKIIGDNVE